MNRYRVYAYPWELLDGDPDVAFGELIDLGVDTISVCPVYHRVHCVMPRNPTRKTFIADASYAYFTPNEDRYRRSGILPAVHPAGTERRYGEVVDAARRYGLGVSAWVIALHYSPHFAQYREFATHNLWGEPNVESLCPSHPAVQEYLADLAADLVEQFDVDEVELETPHWDVFFNNTHGIHERIGVTFDPLDILAMSLCFCPACVRGAGAADIDVVSLRAGLARKVEGALRTGSGPLRAVAAEDLADLPELPAFLDFRRSVSTQVANLAANSVDCPVSVMYDGAPVYGLDAGALAEVGARLTGLTYSGSTATVRDRAARLLDDHPHPADWRIVLSLFAAHMPSHDTLAEHLRALATIGVTDFGFYNSSLAATEAMIALRRALADAAGTRPSELLPVTEMEER